MILRLIAYSATVLMFPFAVSAEWLGFNAGTPENSTPLIQHNDAWDDYLTFDVELRGLLADTIEVDSTDYLRFNMTPGTITPDSVGYPELPLVRCFVWVPDSTDLSLQYALNCMETISCIPVYPRPLDSLRADSVDCPYIDEFFRKDSSAYVSDEWYPDTLVRLVNEFHLRDARITIVDVYPVQYLADDDSLRVWSDIEVMIQFDDTTEVWSTRDLGPYEDLVGDRILGYEADDNTYAPISGIVMRPETLTVDPRRVPDYVILVAEGLDGNWIDTLAHHRADLCGFDVAIVRTDSVLSQFSESAVLTPTIIRDFTETMWDWGQPSSSKRPSYLLLIGDHEDSDSSSAGWFLPTMVYEETTPSHEGEDSVGDDCWYVYLDESYSEHHSYPDMMVGRLSARDTTTIQDMIDVIIDYEAASSLPAPDSLSWRREILHLYGMDITAEDYGPDSSWTSAITDWCGYDWDYIYGGDFRSYTTSDSSTMTSLEWDSLLTYHLSEGQLITMYVNHGLPHLFSAGTDYAQGSSFKFEGIPDSVFNCFDVDSLSFEEVTHHGYPFIINACCATGRFCHTEAEHSNGEAQDPRWYYCFNSDSTKGPIFKFPVDCLGERFMSNTDMGAIGFFAATASTRMAHYEELCIGITEAVLEQGLTRVGDAIARMRFQHLDSRLGVDIALYNLLGDPAVDLGDRVKFRNCCDLIVAPSDLDVSRYPTLAYGGSTTASLHVTIRNAGADSSGAFDADLRIRIGDISHDTTLTETFPSIAPGQDTTLTFDGWVVPDSLTSTMDILLTCTADDDEDCTESWTDNNQTSRTIRIEDFYPNDAGWPVLMPGSIKSPPTLVDLDDDGDLDIIVIAGWSQILAIDPDDPDDPIWITSGYAFNSFNTTAPNGYTIPAAGDVTGDGDPEIVVDTFDELLVLDGDDGDLLCSFSHDDLGQEWSDYPHTVVLADVFRETGGMIPRNEIACVCADSLFILRYESGSLNKLDSIAVVTPAQTLYFAWIAAAELDGEDGDDLVVTTTRQGTSSTLALYSSDSPGSFYADTTWSRNLFSIPAIGDLGTAGDIIAISKYPIDINDRNPADLIDPSDLSTEVGCRTSSSTYSAQNLCCMMVDWETGAGLDRVVVPSARQACVFEDNGDEDWYDVYSTTGSKLPPFSALGDIDDDGSPDVINGIRMEGIVYAFNYEGNPIGGAGFPFNLPSEVYGGFLIADIDEDEKVEIIFGTMDNYLHVWEFDACDSSYAPWPQVQHDAMRSGALE